MALNKFEQHIKEELNKREIMPNSSSWDKVVNQLDNPQKQKKSNYLWWGIAASFAGLLIISTIYFNYDKTDSNTPHIIVDTDNEALEIKVNETDILIEKVEKTEIVNTNTKNHEVNKALDNEIKIIESNNYPSKNEITEVLIVNPKLEIELNEDEFGQKKLIEQKIAEVIAKVDRLEQNNNTLTDLEVDSLILKAQQEILQNKIFRQNQSVDAMALLNEVEDELDKPLKDQLFDLLKKGIFETRNVIADRN